MIDQVASVVITHYIKKGKENAYKQWLSEISQLSKRSTGFADWQIVRPIHGLTYVYAVIILFNTIANLKGWMDSPEREEMIQKANAHFAKDDNYIIKSGLDFLFNADNARHKVPVRWKQYLITWSAIYPLSPLIPLVILPIVRKLNLPSNHYLDALFISGVIVLLMVYVIMPSYTKLIKSWLYR